MQMVFGVRRTVYVSLQIHLFHFKSLTPSWQPSPKQEPRTLCPQRFRQNRHYALSSALLIHDSALEHVGRCADRGSDSPGGGGCGKVERHAFGEEVGGEEGVLEEIVGD